MRGLFGRRLSYLPTAINVVQLLGWTVFEIVVIASAAQQLFPWHAHRWPYVLVAGVLTAAMTIRPLGAVRILRRYALGAVVVTTTYLFIELLRHPHVVAHPRIVVGFLGGCRRRGRGRGVVGAARRDYTRHSVSSRSAFGGAVLGYSVTQIAGYLLGLVALATVVQASDAEPPARHVRGVHRACRSAGLPSASSCCGSSTSRSPTGTPRSCRCRTSGRVSTAGSSRSSSAGSRRSARCG